MKYNRSGSMSHKNVIFLAIEKCKQIKNKINSEINKSLIFFSKKTIKL